MGQTCCKILEWQALPALRGSLCNRQPPLRASMQLGTARASSDWEQHEMLPDSSNSSAAHRSARPAAAWQSGDKLCLGSPLHPSIAHSVCGESALIPHTTQWHLHLLPLMHQS